MRKTENKYLVCCYKQHENDTVQPGERYFFLQRDTDNKSLSLPFVYLSFLRQHTLDKYIHNTNVFELKKIIKEEEKGDSEKYIYKILTVEEFYKFLDDINYKLPS